MQLDAQHEGGHYIKVKFDWISATGETVELTNNDTGFMKDWNLIQIEGEEPV